MALAGRDPDAAVYTSSMVLQFGLGCAVAWACDRGLHRFAMPALVLGFAGSLPERPGPLTAAYCRACPGR